MFTSVLHLRQSFQVGDETSRRCRASQSRSAAADCANFTLYQMHADYAAAGTEAVDMELLEHLPQDVIPQYKNIIARVPPAQHERGASVKLQL